MMKRIGELKADLAKMTAWGRSLEHDKRLLQEENARLKAECQARQAENSVLAVECDSLKAEVERLKGIILAQSSEFVCNATKREAEPLPDGWNSSIAKACDLLAEKEKEIARLKAEVERLTTWQPMETAPLDGTDVLCVCLDPEFEGEDNPNRYIRTCFFGLMTEDYRCWMSVFGYEENPTHWMPLPAAPAKEERP